MSDLIVRASTEADVARCAEIYAHHVVHGTASFEVDPPDVTEMKKRRAAVLDLGLPHLVAERAGFEMVGTLKSIGFKFGGWRDSVLMQRALGTGDTIAPGGN
jgi:L-amino acid N-acyltransferase YncA